MSCAEAVRVAEEGEVAVLVTEESPRACTVPVLRLWLRLRLWLWLRPWLCNDDKEEESRKLAPAPAAAIGAGVVIVSGDVT